MTLSALFLAGFALADEPQHTTEARPWLVLAEASMGGPSGIMGGRVGYKSVELGGGLGATGYKAHGQWKYYWTPFDSDILSFPVGVGPSIGLNGEAVGIERDWGEKEGEEPRLLFASWLNAEMSAEWRARWGGVWRWTIGGAVRLYENQSQLCEGVEVPEYPDYNACYDLAAFPSSPIAASWPIFPYLGFAYGYAF